MTITSRSELHKLLDFYSLPRTVCECGVAEAIFSKEIYSWGIDKLYLIDLWNNIPFIEGCASFEQSWHDKNYHEATHKFKDNPNVILLRGFSYKMAQEIPDESLGLCYIDADHSYQGVKSDIISFMPKLVKGGIMAFHDYGNIGYGVNRAVQEFTKNEGLYILEENGDVNNMGAYFFKK